MGLARVGMPVDKFTLVNGLMVKSMEMDVFLNLMDQNFKVFGLKGRKEELVHCQLKQ
jgi:hypothetical protein